MKKLLLIAGLAGIVVTGAFAQGNGNTSSNTSVLVTVANYVNISSITGTFSVNVTDGGFLGPYALSGAPAFNVIANTGWTLHVANPTNNASFPYNVTATTSVTGGTATQVSGQNVTMSGTLAGDPTNGLPADLTGHTGTITVSITAP